MTQKLLATLYCPESTHTQRVASDMAEEDIVRNFGGVTIDHGYGRWVSKHGHVVGDRVRKLSVVCEGRDKMMHIAAEFKARSGEETVLITFQPIESYFI